MTLIANSVLLSSLYTQKHVNISASFHSQSFVSPIRSQWRCLSWVISYWLWRSLPASFSRPSQLTKTSSPGERRTTRYTATWSQCTRTGSWHSPSEVTTCWRERPTSCLICWRVLLSNQASLSSYRSWVPSRSVPHHLPSTHSTLWKSSICRWKN